MKHIKLFEQIENNNITMYKNNTTRALTSNFEITPLSKINDDDIMSLYDLNEIYVGTVKGPSWALHFWKYFEFKDLPKEIKDRLT